MNYQLLARHIRDDEWVMIESFSSLTECLKRLSEEIEDDPTTDFEFKIYRTFQ